MDSMYSIHYVVYILDTFTTNFHLAIAPSREVLVRLRQTCPFGVGIPTPVTRLSPGEYAELLHRLIRARLSMHSNQF